MPDVPEARRPLIPAHAMNLQGNDHSAAFGYLAFSREQWSAC
jgi:hypothetical protein